MRRLIFVLSAAAVLLTLPGCWNRIELNELSIVSATGVDADEKGQWKMSFQLVIPQAISNTTGGASTDVAPVYVFSTSGPTMGIAVNRTSEELSRHLYFAHTQMLVMSQKVARTGIEGMLDDYMRNPDSRETTVVFLTGGDARTVLEQLMPMERNPAAALLRMAQNESANGSVYPLTTIFQVMAELLGPTHAAGIPSLDLAGRGEPFDKLDNAKSTHTETKLRLTRLGVIRDGKLVGWLNDQESLGAAWLSDRISRTVVSYPCADSGGRPLNSIRLLKANTAAKPVRQGGKIAMKLHVKASGTLVEYGCGEDLTKPEAVSRNERAIEERIKALMEEGWKAVQRRHADIVGFGAAVRERYPRLWREIGPTWNDKLDEVAIDVDVHVAMKQTGMNSNSVNTVEKRE